MIKRVLLTGGTGDKGLTPFSLSQMQWQPENDMGMGDSYVRNMCMEKKEHSRLQKP